MDAKRSTLIVGVATLVLAATISTHGRDRDNRVIRSQSCEDVNEDLSADQFSPTNCLEGHGCVYCDDELNPFGVYAGPNGTGDKVDQAFVFGCNGLRLIGLCVSSGSGLQFCDRSSPYVDGACDNPVTNYHRQDEPGGS